MILFVSAFATVFLLVFQQQNVIYRQYLLATLTSALITATQFVVIKGAADGNLVDMVYMILGGMLGVLTSMKTHEAMVQWFQRRNRANGSATDPVRHPAAGFVTDKYRNHDPETQLLNNKPTRGDNPR